MALTAFIFHSRGSSCCTCARLKHRFVPLPTSGKLSAIFYYVHNI